MKLFTSLLIFAVSHLVLSSASGSVIISGFMANPTGTDSPYEYVQLVATSTINFSTTPYSVVVANNGTATSAGWNAGGGLTYGFTINSGTVTPGDVFYVGGNGKLVNGAGSSSLATLTWLREINTGTTPGDGFGTAAAGGVFGNGGANADGIAVFDTDAASLTASTVPLDAVFFGTGVGTAKPATGGYQVPANDLFTGGIFGATGNTTLFADPASGAYTKLSGTYDWSTHSWSIARTGSLVASPTSISSITSGIASVPEPTAALLGSVGLLGLLRRRRC
jgi:hypothetical protein